MKNTPVRQSQKIRKLAAFLGSCGREARTAGALNALTLSSSEKNEIRSALSSHISFSLPSPLQTSLTSQKKVRVKFTFGFTRNFIQKLITFFHMIIALILAVLLGGGVSFAAEGSLPGDALYPIKTEVNEEISSLLAISDQAEADLQAKLAARRLEEAAKLARLGRLTPENRAKVEEQFSAHTQKSEGIAVRAEESQDLSAAVGIRSALESSISAHMKVLEKIDTKTPEGRAEVNAVLDAVRVRLENITDARASAEIKIGKDNVTIEQRTKDARAGVAEKIREVKKDFEEFEKTQIEFSAQAQARAEIAAQISLAEKSFAEGEIHYGVSAYSNAFGLYQQALRAAQEARFFILAEKEFGTSADASTDTSTEANGEITDSDNADQSATTTTATTTREETKKENQETTSSTTVRQTTEANINTRNASATLRTKVEVGL